VKCPHEFSWPRKAASGDYYQVCLVCGDEYQYDWPSMRRLGKRTESSPQVSGTEANVSVARKASWTPRARRLKSPIAVQLRVQGGSEFRPGTIENISQSGLFLKIEDCPAKHETLEMIFEMPVEISGQHNAKVLCIGKVVRIAEPKDGSSESGCAVTILDYHFVHDEDRKKGQSGRHPRSSSDQLA
jgi:hypothetical protein